MNLFYLNNKKYIYIRKKKHKKGKNVQVFTQHFSLIEWSKVKKKSTFPINIILSPKLS